MRVLKVCVVVSLLLVLPISVLPQTSTTQSSPQALTLLQNSLAALTGGKSITDITLSGTARRIAGSDDESGMATLKALASGAARMDLTLSSGPRTEILNSTATPPVGSWSGPDGVSHPISYHNLLTDSAWFFPAFTLGRVLISGSYVVEYIGQETHNGQSVQHVSVSQSPPSPDPPGAPSFAHLTQIDFFLDSTTLFPAAITFNTHPDNNSRLDLLVEIRFTDYRSVNGSQIPCHIQKFLNNSLLLDFQAQTVTPNTGLSASAFNAL